MDFLTQTLLAIVYVIANSALEAVGERIANNSIDRFLELLEQPSKDTVIAIKEQPVEDLDYKWLFEEVKLEAQNNPQFAQTTKELAFTAQEHPLPNMNRVLDNFRVVEELQPQISEIKSLIDTLNKKMVNTDEIKRYLPDATNEQAERYTKEVQRLGELESFFSHYPDELNGYKNYLTRAQKAFNYKQPYRIAVIGITGAGKSTMLNAMLGRELVLTKVGKAATGAVLEIFLDISENEEEKAVVTYRDRDNILQLIYDHFVQRYRLDESQLNGEIDDSFFEAIESSQYPGDDDEARQEFEELREILIDLGKQYTNNDVSSLKTDFSLSNHNDCKELMQLIDENSYLNKDPNQRRIGLVKSVRYHIKSDKNSHGLHTLQLPNNTCLVDLPGLDGSPLHDIIIGEGIKDADAVIFIMRTPRILGRGDDTLLKRVRKHISPEGIEQSGERIFVVLNGKDTITSDNLPPNLLRDMGELMELLPSYADSSQLSKRGGNTPYFITSAWAAYCAQKKLKGESIEDSTTYESIKMKLRVNNGDDQKVLEVSQVPKLVEELTKFARDQRIEGQIRDGKQALDSIINQIYSNCKIQYSELNDDPNSSKEQEELKLDEHKKKLKNRLANFREGIFEELQQESKLQARNHKVENICNQADDSLQQKMPDIWRTYFKSDVDRLATKGNKLLAHSFYEPILTDAQIYLWHQLNKLVPQLAKYFVQVYKDQFEERKITELIYHGCGGSISKKIQELESKIENIIQTMDSRMEQMSQRIAMTIMTDPSTYFSNQNSEEENKKQVIFELEQIPYNREIPVENFKDFIKQVREMYEKYVSVDCVDRLLNLYRYELICIEDGLFSFITEVFYDIRDNADKYQKAQFLSESDLKLLLMQSLEAKLTALSSIKE